MRWVGEDPASSLEAEIKAGIKTAKRLIDTIIQP